MSAMAGRESLGGETLGRMSQAPGLGRRNNGIPGSEQPRGTVKSGTEPNDRPFLDKGWTMSVWGRPSAAAISKDAPDSVGEKKEGKAAGDEFMLLLL